LPLISNCNLPTLPVQPTRPSPQPITTNTAIESSTRNLTTILPTGNKYI
jgi:hypothetical protein